MGLSGTGSKNVRMTDTFIPDYRVVEAPKMIEGAYVATASPASRSTRCPSAAPSRSAITSGTLGIARGALDAYRDYMQKRVSAAGVVAKVDPFQQAALAEAEADWTSAVIVIDTLTDRMVRPGRRAARRSRPGSGSTSAATRCVPCSASWSRSTRSTPSPGSASVWTDKPLERYWRDLRTGGSHICNIYDTAYTSWANFEFQTGGPVNTMH